MGSAQGFCASKSGVCVQEESRINPNSPRQQLTHCGDEREECVHLSGVITEAGLVLFGLPGFCCAADKPGQDILWSRGTTPLDQVPELVRLFAFDLPELREMSIDMEESGETSSGPRPPHHFRSGAVYTGEWKGRARHGFGVQRWPDGTCYEGEWVNSAAEGRGRITFSNGDIYTGQWASSTLHGLGVYRANDGTVYMGNWVKDHREGHGFEITGDDHPGVKYAGTFRAGQKEGPGVGAWPDGGQYAGEWQGDQVGGKGVHRNARGGTFYGEWQNAARHGIGCHVWQDGRSYMGNYVANTEVSIGCYFDPSGEKCTIGCWQDGEFFRIEPRKDLEFSKALLKLAATRPLQEDEGSVAPPLTPPANKRVSWGSVDKMDYL